MKKRLRRKKRIGEFKQIGYVINIDDSAIINDCTLDELLQLIEDYGLVCAGSISSLTIYKEGVARKERSNISINNAESIKRWLAERNINCEISEPYDIWHDSLC